MGVLMGGRPWRPGFGVGGAPAVCPRVGVGAALIAALAPGPGLGRRARWLGVRQARGALGPRERVEERLRTGPPVVDT